MRIDVHGLLLVKVVASQTTSSVAIYVNIRVKKQTFDFFAVIAQKDVVET